MFCNIRYNSTAGSSTGTAIDQKHYRSIWFTDEDGVVDSINTS